MHHSPRQCSGGSRSIFCAQAYFLLLKHINVFDQAKLIEQLRQVICHTRGGTLLAAG